MASPGQVTQLLARVRSGDAEARDELLRATYDDLRRLARAQLRRERAGHTLQATALVHEACLHMLGDKAPGENRTQFLAFAAEVMRHILISHARSRGRAKRGGAADRIALEIGNLVAPPSATPDLIALDEALRRLRELDPRKGRVVELRFFGGMTFPQVAEALGVSDRTVKRDWDVARSWLLEELGEEEHHAG